MPNPELHAPDYPVGQMTGGEEYPKMLYKGDAGDYEHCTVESADAEVAAVTEGWRCNLHDKDVKSTAVAMADKDAEIAELRRRLEEQAAAPERRGPGRPPKATEVLTPQE